MNWGQTPRKLKFFRGVNFFIFFTEIQKPKNFIHRYKNSTEISTDDYSHSGTPIKHFPNSPIPQFINLSISQFINLSIYQFINFLWTFCVQPFNFQQNAIVIKIKIPIFVPFVLSNTAGNSFDSVSFCFWGIIIPESALKPFHSRTKSRNECQLPHPVKQIPRQARQIPW